MNSIVSPIQYVYGQAIFRLPQPGQMVSLSPAFNPTVLRGIKIYPNNPFRFDFILDTGDENRPADELQENSVRLIKYFLAALTIPEKDLWVNLSPYENDRIVSEAFGQTAMGRDLLAQDYILKQITASVIYPESEIGKKFWAKIYQVAFEKYGTADIPVDTFNKVWIVPDKAVIYEGNDRVFVVNSSLKVMLEQDYLAMREISRGGKDNNSGIEQAKLGADVVREVVIPLLQKEVNTGENFAPLRQIYGALILAKWFKETLKESILGQGYAGQGKIFGLEIDDKEECRKIYDRYLEAFRKGVFNYIKEDELAAADTLPRKYFSGGFDSADLALERGATSQTAYNTLEGKPLKLCAVEFDSAMRKRDAKEDLPVAAPYLLSRKPPEAVKRIYQDDQGRSHLAMSALPEGTVSYFLNAVIESGLKDNIVLHGGGVRDLLSGSVPRNINYFVRGSYDPRALAQLQAEVSKATGIMLVNMGKVEDFNFSNPELSINRIVLEFDARSNDPLIIDQGGGLDDLLTNQAVLVGRKMDPLAWSILLPRIMEKMIRFKLKPGPRDRQLFQEFLDWVDGPYAQVLATETPNNTDRQVLAVCDVYRKWIAFSFAAVDFDRQVEELWGAIKSWSDIEEQVEPGKDLLGILGIAGPSDLNDYLAGSAVSEGEAQGETSQGPDYQRMQNAWLEINGGAPLRGEITLGGSKHSVTNLMGALLLANGHLELDNFPTSRDGMEMLAIYHSFGVVSRLEGNRLILDVEPGKLQFSGAETKRARLLRASILLLGSALLRFGRVEFPGPGGDKIGRDFHKHFEILDAFGIRHGPAEADMVTAYLDKPLEGDFVIDALIRTGSGEGYSGTYTTALAMTLAAGNKGKTTISHAIVASEISELGRFLQQLGVRIEGLGTEHLVITSPGVADLQKKDLTHRIDPDKVEFAFWTVAAIMTKGQIDIRMDYDEPVSLDNLGPLGSFYREVLEPMGITIVQINENTFRVDARQVHLKPVDLKTVYRGRYANWADILMQLLPLLAVTPGKSSFVDTKHGNIRLRGRESLNAMGARIITAEGGVEVNGVDTLYPATTLHGADIRDASNLLLAALGASGKSVLYGKEYIERSYDGVLAKITRIGGDVRSMERPPVITEASTDAEIETAVRAFLRSQKFGYSLDNDTGGVYVRTVVQTFGDDLRGMAKNGRTVPDIVQENEDFQEALYMGELSRMFRYGNLFEAVQAKTMPDAIDALVKEYQVSGTPQVLEIGIIGVSYGQELVSIPIALERTVRSALRDKGLPDTAIVIKVKAFNKQTAIYSKVKANRVYYPADLMDIYKNDISPEEAQRYFQPTPKGLVRSTEFEQRIEFFDVDLTDKNTFPALPASLRLLFVHNVLHHVSTFLHTQLPEDIVKRHVAEAEGFMNSLVLKGGGVSIVAQGDYFYGGDERKPPPGFVLANPQGMRREILFVRTEEPVGGIDLSADRLALEREGGGRSSPISPGQMPAPIMDYDGLIPLVLGITTVRDLGELLGAASSH